MKHIGHLGYRGFKSKEAYEAYYSNVENYRHELPMMAEYAREAKMERKELEMANEKEDTKACSLTEAEIKQLIAHHGYNLSDDTDTRVERISYLNKRLKAFSEPTEEKQPATAVANETKPTAQGWGAQ